MTSLILDPSEEVALLARRGEGTPSTPVLVFLATLLTKSSRATAVYAFRRIARALRIRDWQTIPWEKLTAVETTILRTRLIEQHSPTTVRLTLSMLRGVLRAAFNLGLLSADALMRATSWPRLKTVRIPKGRALTPEEIACLRRHCQSQKAPYGTLLLGIFAVLVGAGCRREEVAVLGQDALQGSHLRILGKGQKERLSKIPSWAAADLRTWLQVRADLHRDLPSTLFVRVDRTGRVYSASLSPWGVWNLVTSTTEDAGIENISTHDFRRTYASHLLDTTDIANVQRLMGHASATTTVLYDRRGQDAANKAVDSLEVFGNTDRRDGR